MLLPYKLFVGPLDVITVEAHFSQTHLASALPVQLNPQKSFHVINFCSRNSGLNKKHI